MKYTFYGKDNSIIYIESEDVLIEDAQSALDLIATIMFEKNCNKIILDKKVICEDFFILSSGIAGEILQKFINYRTKLAVVGDFSKYTSKPLQDFIFECNKGNNIFFVDNLDQAVNKLDLAN